MKNKLLHTLLVIALFFVISPAFTQQMSILRSTGFTNPQNLITGTSATTYTNSSGSFEIVVQLDYSNYIEELTLIVNSGSSYTCRVLTSKDDSNYQLAGTATVGSNNYVVNAYAKYIKIEVDVPSGYMILNELTAKTQYRSIAFTYDAAGNRTSRYLSIELNKSTYNNGMLIPEGTVDWDELGVKLYPNPTHGELIFEFENYPEDDKVRYELYGLNGKKLIKEKMSNTSTILNIESYPEGNYILHIYVGQELKTYQIVKQ